MKFKKARRKFCKTLKEGGEMWQVYHANMACVIYDDLKNKGKGMSMERCNDTAAKVLRHITS